MSQGISVWVLEAPDGFGDAGYHAHHAIQLTFSLSGQLTLSSAAETISAPFLAVAADARHRFDAAGLLAFIFVEPESRAGRALTETLLRGRDLMAIERPDIAALLDPLRSALDHRAGKDVLLGAGHAVVEALAPAIQAREADPRIQRIIDHASANLDQPLGLAAAAAGVHLSPSRLRHLFVEQTGLAYKTYLLWLRLVRAVDVYSEGRSLTEAAHEAGFSDSAHFSRIFRRTFGLPATTLTRL